MTHHVGTTEVLHTSGPTARWATSLRPVGCRSRRTALHRSRQTTLRPRIEGLDYEPTLFDLL